MAYEQYLQSHGLATCRASNWRSTNLKDARAAVAFMGFVGRWNSWDKPLVCDFASRSTRFPRHGRDAAKIILGRTPDLGVYQSRYVQRGTPRGRKSIFRDMGYFSDLLKPRNLVPQWDVIYVGETRRPGLVEELDRLSRWGLSIAVAGPPVTLPRGLFHLGRLDAAATYSALANSRFGLNYLPNRPPYKHQQSTKLIEYVASGLNVISTRTPGVEEFLERRGGKVAWLDEIKTPADLLVDYDPPCVSDLAWDKIMEKTGIAEWLMGQGLGA